MTLTLSTYGICIGITVVNLVMLAFMLPSLREGRNLVANRLLALFCLAHAGGNLSDLLSSKHLYDRYPLLIETDTLVLMFVGPLCLLYVQAMTQLRFQLRWRQLWHLLPIAVYLLWLLPFKLQPPAVQLTQYYDWTSGRLPIPLMALIYPKSLIFMYLGAAYWLVLRHQRTVREVLADVDQKDLHWLKGLVIVMVGLYVAWILDMMGWLPPLFLGLAHIGYSYWLGYYVINQKAIYTHVTNTVSLELLDEQPKTRYRNSTMTETDKQALVERIGRFMLTDKPYLDKDLTLTTLAEQLRLSPTQVSQVLNEGFGENFYTFINRHRVEESKQLLVNPAFAHYSILGVAFEAGFNTKSTFNKTFREVVGQSPSDYQKTQSIVNKKMSDSA
jgi:AraC-like DNA-binding protein